MAEVNQKKKKITAGTWIALALALILIIECGIVAVHFVYSRTQAGQVSIEHEHGESLTHGIVLYDLDPDFKVDHNLLLKLMDLSEQDINTVRLPLDVSKQIEVDGNQLSLNGEWLYQTASLSEMIFQSEYRLLLSLVIDESVDITPDSYELLWKQINDAFGHRPAEELWFEITVNDNEQSASWDAAREAIIKNLRLTNAEREIVLALPASADTDMLKTASDLCRAYKLHLAAFAQPDMNSSVLDYMNKTTFQNEVSVILIEPEDAETNYTETMAQNYGFGYLLQGD